MKKTLLIAAAALAAGVISTQAQPVYSQNIVGYVNTVMPGNNNLSLITAPLGGTNTAENVISSVQVGDNIFIWTGGGYNILTYVGPNGDGAGHSWVDGNGNGQNSPVLSPGQGVFYQNSGSSALTNTFVGDVILTNSIVIPGNNNLSLLASTLPIGDTADGTNMALPFQVGDNIFLWTGGGYNILTYVGPNGDGAGHSFVDGNGNGQPSPTIPVGQGFFYQNSGSANEVWNQGLSVQ